MFSQRYLGLSVCFFVSIGISALGDYIVHLIRRKFLATGYYVSDIVLKQDNNRVDILSIEYNTASIKNLHNTCNGFISSSDVILDCHNCL